jgi:hypothetical protein
VKVTEKKKEKKKEKRTNQEEPAEQQDNTTQDIPIETHNAEKPKDNKKKKKLKKAYSTSTTIVPEVSSLNEQLGNPKGANTDKLQGPPQEKISEQHNDSSNSCLQPPPIKVLSKTFSYV